MTDQSTEAKPECEHEVDYSKENAVFALKRLRVAMDAAVISLTKLSRTVDEAGRKAKELRGAWEIAGQWIDGLEKDLAADKDGADASTDSTVP